MPDASQTPAAPSSLLDRLRAESDAAVATCLDQARTTATFLLESAERDAAESCAAALAARRREHDDARTHARTKAEQHVLRKTLVARADAIDRVLVAASVLAQGSEAQLNRAALLERDIVRAVMYLPAGAMVVNCSDNVAATVGDIVTRVCAGNASVQPNPGMGPGIIIHSADGALEVNATVARRLATERPRLAILIAKMLEDMFASAPPNAPVTAP